MEVELEEDDRLCKLVIDEADEDDHAGEWEVTVYGSCDGDKEEFRMGGGGKKKKKGRRRKRLGHCNFLVPIPFDTHI